MAIATYPDFIRAPASQGLYDEIRKLPLEDGIRVIPAFDPTQSRTTKGWSGDMAAKFNMSSAWTSATLAGWEKGGRIELVRVDKRIVGVRLPEDQQQAAPTSLKDQVHSLMKREADDKGRVHKDTDEMRRELGVSPHDFIKAAWDLQKHGILTFRQTGGTGSSANLINYRLRGYKTNVVGFDDPENPLTTKPWDICPDCHNTRKQHTLSNDNSGLICPAPKEGSPLAARLAKEEADKRAAKEQGNGDTVRSKPIVPMLNGYVECPDCGSTFADQVSLNMHTKAKHAPAPEPKPAVAVQAVLPFHVERTFDWSKYPMLTGVVKHYHARLAAITALQMAGEDEMATALMDKEETLPKETREVIALLTAMGYEG